MDQQQIWEAKWSDPALTLPANNFARRAYSLLDPSHKTLSDLGCGAGGDALYFAKKGLQVTAVDWSTTGLTILSDRAKRQKLGNITVLQQDITRLDFPKVSFDVVYAHLSLHTFDSQTTQNIFETIHYILKNDGLFFVKCKSVDDLRFGQGRKIADNTYEHKGKIRHFFDKEYMHSLLDNYRDVRVRRSSSVYHSYKASFIEAVAKK